MIDAAATHRLSPNQLATLACILAPFADQIERVGLFGSRATGKARRNSDINLVLYGALDATAVDRIWTLCDESGLAVKVDVSAYGLITRPSLKTHIDEVMLPLFSRDDLRAAEQSPLGNQSDL